MKSSGERTASTHLEPAGPGPTGDRFRLLALAALTVALIGLCVLLTIPFLPAVTWGVALAIIAWPLHRWVSRHVAQPNLAAAVSTAAVVVVILVPVLFVSYNLAREAGSAADRVREESAGGGLGDKVAGVPGARDVVAWMQRVGVDVEDEIRKVVASYTQDVSALAQGSLAAAVQFLAAVFILFYLFRDRTAFQEGVRDLLPLSRSESDRVFATADSVHANLHATVITSLIDTVGGVFMFWVLGLPSPFLWGVVMFVLCLMPIVGAAMIWLPASAYLALTGQWPQAAALATWGVVTSVVVDNILYVRLAGERMRMHEVPALIAFLGGLAVFGVSGMILGPAILAVTVAILEAWKRRVGGSEAPVTAADLAAPAGLVGVEPELRTRSRA